MDNIYPDAPHTVSSFLSAASFAGLELLNRSNFLIILLLPLIRLYPMWFKLIKRSLEMKKRGIPHELVAKAPSSTLIEEMKLSFGPCLLFVVPLSVVTFIPSMLLIMMLGHAIIHAGSGGIYNFLLIECLIINSFALLAVLGLASAVVAFMRMGKAKTLST